jgi:hypothetical protein
MAGAHVGQEVKMLVAIALANKMARTIWAMLARNEENRDPRGVFCRPCSRPYGES